MNEINHTLRSLSNRLTDKLHRDGDTVKAVAEHLGISQSYLTQLLQGGRDFATADIEVLRKIAGYLNLPPIFCLLLADKICDADFYESPMELNVQIDSVLSMVAESPSGLEAAVDVSELRTLPTKTKLLLALMYQSALGIELLSSKKRWSWSWTEKTDVSPLEPLFRQE